MSYQYLIIEKENGIATLTINRPETLNAIDIPTLLEMEQAVNDVKNDESIRVLVITGAGEKAFIAGGDIADLNSRHAIESIIPTGLISFHFYPYAFWIKGRQLI